MIEVVPDQKNI